MAVSQNPVPDGPHKPLLHTLETRGLLHTPCRALSRGYKRVRIAELVAPGARLVHTPCNGVCRVVWALALLQAFGSDPLPYIGIRVILGLYGVILG